MYDFPTVNTYKIMAEYPVTSTSQGTYSQIEQTYVIRDSYEICRAGGARTGIGKCWFSELTCK